MSSNSTTWSFLPWVRQGVASKINNLEDLDSSYVAGPSERASITVSVDLEADGTAAGTVSRDVKLAGPGDVIGLSPDSILRMEPVPGTENFEDNYLAYIEFYEEDLPWRYTPAMPQGNGPKLRPWLYLLVVKAAEFSLEDGRYNQPLPYLKLTASDALPADARDSWAFAHVQVNEDLLEAGNYLTNLQAAVAENPDLAHSRLLSPRKLEPDSNYTAFLIPAYEVGRLAGLGRDTAGVDAWLPSWGHAGYDDLHPIYHSWSFATGSGGDFESLVTKLEARVLPPEVGVRQLDIQEAAQELSANINEEFTGIGGALKTEYTSNYPFTSTDFETALEDLLNLQEEQSDGTVTATDPIVTPDLYGRWHAAEQKVPTADGWVRTLNLDPGLRAAAGLGARVVREHQDRFMEFAWEQAGQIIEANRAIGFAELAAEATGSMYERHLKSQPDGRLLTMTSSLHRTQTLGNLSMKVIADNSKMHSSTFSPTLHRILRPNGKFRKRFDGLDLELVQNTSNGTVALNLPKTVIDSGTATAVFHSNADIEVLATENPANLNSEASDNPFIALRAHLDEYTEAGPKDDLLLSPLRAGLLEVMDPEKAIVAPLAARLQLESNMVGPSATTLKPVMAHPIFPLPTYPYLNEISADFIIPNIAQIPDNSMTLMVPNLEFIEAFMVGMNHEMSRELLWREYPTDQRGTYFRHFWDKTDNPEVLNTGTSLASDAYDIDPIDTWAVTSALGSHEIEPLGGQSVPVGGSPKVFLLVRGELLRKYPDAIIYAQKAVWQNGVGGSPDLSAPRQLDTSGAADSILFPHFKASAGNDVAFFAFDLTVAEAKGAQTVSDPGWFFVIRERAGKTRFGLDVATAYSGSAATSWSDLTWGHLSGPASFTDMQNISLANPNADANTLTGNNMAVWANSSADMANILFQDPVLIAYHATDMLNF